MELDDDGLSASDSGRIPFGTQRRRGPREVNDRDRQVHDMMRDAVMWSRARAYTPAYLQQQRQRRRQPPREARQDQGDDAHRDNHHGRSGNHYTTQQQQQDQGVDALVDAPMLSGGMSIAATSVVDGPRMCPQLSLLCPCSGSGTTTLRRASLATKLAPLLEADGISLEAHQALWMQRRLVPFFDAIQRKAERGRERAGKYRRFLIFFGVIVSALFLLQNTTYVRDNGTVFTIMFFVTSIASLVNNYFTAVMTDLKLNERATLYMRASAYLHTMVDTFLTVSQRYANFGSCKEAFRTFVRDVVNVRILLVNQETGFMMGNNDKQPRASDAIVAERQDWNEMFKRLSIKEALAMNELPYHRRRNQPLSAAEAHLKRSTTSGSRPDPHASGVSRRHPAQEQDPPPHHGLQGEEERKAHDDGSGVGRGDQTSWSPALVLHSSSTGRPPRAPMRMADAAHVMVDMSPSSPPPVPQTHTSYHTTPPCASSGRSRSQDLETGSIVSDAQAANVLLELGVMTPQDGDTAP